MENLSSSRFSVVPYLLLGSMLAAAALYVNAQYPSLFVDMKYKLIDSDMGKTINSGDASETNRIAKIEALIISDRNKIDLREGRPFWGAATHMVELAFKSPADDITIRRSGARIFEFHRYGFNGNREPVVMEFANNALSCVHYPQRKQTLCSPGARSAYDGQPFPFEYRVQISN